jgi:ABC-type antimicrobial peptide transport system permease subunit
LSYFEPVQEGRLKPQTGSFKVKAIVPLEGAAADPDLTPEFPGITNKFTLKDWNPPFPYDGRRVKKTDEDYWNRYRTTPRAYITLQKGQELWSSRFGKLTSIRLAAGTDAKKDLAVAAASFQKHLLEELNPERGGFVFDDVRRRGLDASAGGVDFSMLFLGFSFFLIASALLLVGLLVRLNLDRRAPELGLLLAAGYPVRTVRRLLLAESATLAAVGGLVGLAAAVAYAWGLLRFLQTYWPGDLDRSFLRLHASAASFLIGYVASLVVSLLTIAWAVRLLHRAAPAALLGGQTLQAGTVTGTRPRRSIAIAGASLALGIVVIAAGGFIHDHEMQAGAFFGGGTLLLTAGLTAAFAYLRRPEGSTQGLLAASAAARVGSLGVRNAARYPTRSLLTAGLLASSAFLIVAVESFRRQPGQDFLGKNGGSGGFALIGEAAVPVYQDLNEGPGRQELLESLERAFRQQAGVTTLTENLKRAQVTLDQTRIMALRLRAGDDTSCLNLYQPGRPRLLGVPQSLIGRGGFHFAKLRFDEDPETAKAEHANPWLLLTKSHRDGAIPVFGEENSIGWMLNKKLGDVVELPNEQGRPVKLRIVGLFKDSIFQSELVMAESRFLSLFPSQEGYNFFLIQTPPGQEAEVKTILETALADRGLDVSASSQRLAQYLAVENTYLSTFQALGGLGLLLGTLGLAVVLLRSVWERRGELALLRALGFRQRALGWLVLAENAFLLGLGLLIGAVAAFVSVAPHVIQGQGTVPWLRLLAVLGVVLVVGLAAGSLAMRATLRAPLVPALRRE